MGNLAQFRSQVIVLTGHEGSGFIHVGEKLVQKIKSSHPDSKVLFLEGFWSTLGRNQIDFKKILDQKDPLSRFLVEYLEWKKVIEDLKPHYDLVVVSGTWIKHLASFLALNAEIQLHDHIRHGLSDYPIYLVSQNSCESLTSLQKKSFKSLCELSTVGSRWTLVPSSHSHHLDLLYQQVVRSYLSSAI